jgi:hypothetical protein
VLLLCGNLGLAGDWEQTRSLLARLSHMCRSDAIVLADSVDPTVDPDPEDPAYQDRNRRKGRHVGLVTLRLRYGDLVTPWLDLLNVPRADLDRLVHGTGWGIIDRIDDGEDYLITLGRS